MDIVGVAGVEPATPCGLCRGVVRVPAVPDEGADESTSEEACSDDSHHPEGSDQDLSPVRNTRRDEMLGRHCDRQGDEH